MTVRPFLFPIGPIQLGAEIKLGVFVSRPGQETVAYWGNDWDDLFELTEGRIETDDWETVPRIETLCARAKGRGVDVPIDHMINLSRPLADLIDHDGFGYVKTERTVFDVMRAHALFLRASEGLAEGRSQPVMLEIHDKGGVSQFACAIGRDMGRAFAYVTQTKDMLARMIETAFGGNDLDGVPWVMGMVGPGEGWIGQATHDLYDIAFHPQVRQRNTHGKIMDIDTAHAEYLALLMIGSLPIADGATSVDKTVNLGDRKVDVLVSRFDF